MFLVSTLSPIGGDPGFFTLHCGILQESSSEFPILRCQLLSSSSVFPRRPVASLTATTDRVNGASISPGPGPLLGVRIAIFSLVSAITTRSEWGIESDVQNQHSKKLGILNLELPMGIVAHLYPWGNPSGKKKKGKKKTPLRSVLDLTIPTDNHQ